jgi:hypothetical protein
MLFDPKRLLRQWVLMFLCIPAFARAADSLLVHNWLYYYAGQDTSNMSKRLDTTPALLSTISLPHTFGMENQSSPRQGIGWYIRSLSVPELSDSSDAFLYFEGVCLFAEVYVNNMFIGSSNKAYVPFRIQLPPLKPDKKLTVYIKVDNRLPQNGFPDSNCKGWWLYGGIIREVQLRFLPKLRIDSYTIRTFKCQKDTFNLHVSYKPASVGFDSVRVCVTDGNHDTTIKKTLFSNQATIPVRIRYPWSPESPYRYTITLSPWLKGHPQSSITCLRGFCQLSTDGSRILLNGNRFWIQGLGRHDVLNPVTGPLLTRKQRRTDLLDMKRLGANFLRIAHFPQHRDIYELCDSIGLLVVDEIPAWKTDPIFLGSPEGITRASDYLLTLINQHGNYTCIGLWSLGNEFQSFRTSIADFVQATSQSVKSIDPSRLTTFCSYFYTFDKAFAYVDVIGINEYFGWHIASLGMLGNMLDKIHAQWPNKPIYISEFGAQSALGVRNPSASLSGPVKTLFYHDISEDHQALFLKAHIATFSQRDSFINGYSVWTYNDFFAYTNKPKSNKMPAGLNSCGIVSVDRKHKKAYQIIRDCFKARESSQ